MKLLKFGGRSLANDAGLKNAISIIIEKHRLGEKMAVVVSARDKSTDTLEQLLEDAKQGKDWKRDYEAFMEYQAEPHPIIDYTVEFGLIEQILQGVQLLEDYSPKIKDLMLSQGELLSAKLIAQILSDTGIKSDFVDSRTLIQTDANFGQANVDIEISEKNVQSFFADYDWSRIPIITGFISSNAVGETTTLGRNGSNYTASLIAQFLEVEEVESYTHIDGIYTANPELVYDASIIQKLGYVEAGELAGIGASILHPKTIEPLIEKSIPLRIKNTFNNENHGTLIGDFTDQQGVKTITSKNDVAIISIMGKGLLGKKGIDARIFSTLAIHDISIGVVSQGSSERGVDFLIDKDKVKIAIKSLSEEFEKEFYTKDISEIKAIEDVSVLTIIGQDLKGFTESYEALIKNGIEIKLINNTLNGKNIGLVIAESDVVKALNVIHGHIFGVAKKINIAVFGKGNVGASLINQILASKDKIVERKEMNLNVFAVAGRTKVLLDRNGIKEHWQEDLLAIADVDDVVAATMQYAHEHHLENLVAIDNTASDEFIDQYAHLVQNGYDLISSNKKANTRGLSWYREFRNLLHKNKKQYLYETNVGAGLPLIDTIQLLHSSGENITKIRGVFSGSLSYLFNNFSSHSLPFHEVLQEAIDSGYTEPDAREDLCGNDVARKLLILARELDLANEFDDISIENLIPESLRAVDIDEFNNRLDEFNAVYNDRKSAQESGHVLRYIGELGGDLQQEVGELSVKLESVPENTALGQLKGADSIFEIYTESYGDHPIVIQGAGAGAEVTARGVFGDIIRIAERI